MSVILLATDLDGTLVGDRAALQQFNLVITELRKQHVVKLVYVTGRSPESFKELRAYEPLLEPDALIAAVGTEIYSSDGTRMLGWPIAGNWDVQKVQSLLAHIPDLELQPANGQRQYKVGYFLKDNEPVFRLVQETLKDYPAEVVYCQGIYLDVLPKGSHKGGSIQFLAEQWQIDENEIITCGDSGNDISMLEGNKAIIVGNARDELLQWISKSKPSNIYMAQASFAGGIIEGLKHFQVLL